MDMWINVNCLCMQIKIMQKIENNQIKADKPQFDTIHDLGNPFGRKPSWKVSLLHSLSMLGNMATSTKK